VLYWPDAPNRGENHLISARDGFVVCKIWTRPDLSSEQGAKNAQQMVTYLMDVALRAGTSYGGLVFDVRCGPPVFGPKTREVLVALFGRSIARNVRIAIITGDSATQQLQFRSLCSDTPSMAQLFDNEPDAVQWLRAPLLQKR
jgi:hypothetical protein